MGESSKPSDLIKGPEQSLERKKGFIDWVNLIKTDKLEKDHWVRLDFVLIKLLYCCRFYVKLDSTAMRLSFEIYMYICLFLSTRCLMKQ